MTKNQVFVFGEHGANVIKSFF